MKRIHFRSIKPSGLLLLATVLVPASVGAEQSGFGAGDLFVLLSGDRIQWRRSDGALRETFSRNEGGGFAQAASLFVTQMEASGRWMRISHAADVASDGCSMVYTAGTPYVQRVNLCTDRVPVTVNAAPLPNAEASTVRALPDGGILVTNTAVILRLDPSGNLAQTFDAADEDCWSTLALSSDQASFWASGCNSNIYKFDMASGSQVLAFSAGTDPFTVRGLAEKPARLGKSGGATVKHVIPGARMTGGGSFFTSTGMRVTHGFELHCDTADVPNNLEVNWQGNRFHLETLLAVSCEDTSLDERPPVAGFDTYYGFGAGRYNGTAGYTAEWGFTDAGEPGTSDTAGIWISSNGTAVLGVPYLPSGTPLTFGNHQAHRSTGNN